MDDVAAKNLLINKSCDVCRARKTEDSGGKFCVRWLGEACGWQWMPRPSENTCEDWTDKET